MFDRTRFSRPSALLDTPHPFARRRHTRVASNRSSCENATTPRDGPPTAFTVRSPFEEPPGALSTAVDQANIATTICVAGWTATVRPATSYTQAIRRNMLAQVGAPASEASQYELDHFVPLALGGNPTSLDNLWLQRWLGPWNAHIKDRLERKLQVLVC